MLDEVRLPDLETIRKFSIAVRRERAPVEEVLEALRADVTAIERALGRGRRRTEDEPMREVASPRKSAPARTSAQGRTSSSTTRRTSAAKASGTRGAAKRGRR